MKMFIFFCSYIYNIQYIAKGYMKLLLELFSGTGSVGNVAQQLGYDIVSLDLKKADIKYRYTTMGL